MAAAQRARGPLVHLGVLDPMVDLASPGQALSDGVTRHAALTLAVYAPANHVSALVGSS